MPPEGRSSTVLAPIALVWLLSLFTSVPFGSTPKLPLPAAPNYKVSDRPQEKSVGRLWDDPLEVADALEYRMLGKDEAPPPLRNPPFYTDASAARSPAPGAGPPEIPPAPASSPNFLPEPVGKVLAPPANLAIFVPLRGRRYTENSEWRRRQRYAVQAALWTQGYERLKADEMVVHDLLVEEVFGRKVGAPRPKAGDRCWLRLPEETYELPQRLQGTLPGRVQLFYVNFDLLDDRPLERIYAIAEALGVAKCRLAVTSPPNTNWLSAMMDEGKNDARSKASTTIDVYNSQATGLSDRFVAQVLVKDNSYKAVVVPEADIWIKTQAGDLQVRLHEMIEPDTLAIQRVREELKKRGVKFGEDNTFEGSPSTLAIVSEWETAFGRQFAQEVKKVVEPGWKLPSNPLSPAVLSFFYLRGLDGQPPTARVPGRMAELGTNPELATEARTPGEALSRVIAPAPLPSPVGGTQFDYLARMREQIVHADAERRRTGKGAIRAIGLISTDTDDKLALLKMLRPRFPEVFFFTNDMEADYLQPENIDVTRNLLVAARYDLEGRVFGPALNHLQAQLPSFRSSNQVALVDAVWAALRAKTPRTREVGVYEVGLRRSYRLGQGELPLQKRVAAPAPTGSVPTEIFEDNTNPGKAPWAVEFPKSLPPFTAVVSWALAILAAIFFGWLWADEKRLKQGQKHGEIFRKWMVSGLERLLRGSRPQLEAGDVGAVFRGEREGIEVPPASGHAEEARHWWAFSLVVAIWGVVWWMALGPWGALVVLVASLIALAWLQVHPRQADARIGWVVLAGAALMLVPVIASRALPSGLVSEPMAMADGVCVWPAVVLRFLAAGVALLFVPVAWGELCALRDASTQRFFLERVGDSPGAMRLDREKPAFRPTTAEMARTDWLVAREFPDFAKVKQGSNPDAMRAGLARKNEAEEWLHYLEEADPRKPWALKRWTRWTGAALLITAAAMAATGFPSANTRGWLAGTGDWISLGAALLGLTVLCVFVGDQLWHCRKFVRDIWGHGTTGFGLELEETLLLVAKLTGTVGDLLVYPFAVCFILLCAHSAYLEQWRGLPGLYAMFALALGILLALTWQMQRTAQGVRAKTVAYLQLSLAEALWMKRLVLQQPGSAEKDLKPEESTPAWWRYTLVRLGDHLTLPEVPRTVVAFDDFASNPPEGKTLDEALASARLRDVAFQDARVARIERLIKLVGEFKEGAFGGWYANPILRAVLIPGAGLGSLELAHRLLLG